MPLPLCLAALLVLRLARIGELDPYSGFVFSLDTLTDNTAPEGSHFVHHLATAI